MGEGQPRDRRGTFWDWPVGVIVAAVVLGMFTEARAATFVLFWFGVVSLLIRRGAFSPRR